MRYDNDDLPLLERLLEYFANDKEVSDQFELPFLLIVSLDRLLVHILHVSKE